MKRKATTAVVFFIAANVVVFVVLVSKAIPKLMKQRKELKNRRAAQKAGKLREAKTC